jgi:hypothetical protein
MIEQDTAAMVVFRRTAAGFAREVHQGIDAVVLLGEIGIELPIAEVYETVEFAPESEGD